MRLALPLFAAVLLAACASSGPSRDPSRPHPSGQPDTGAVAVAETWITPERREDELDSLATWPAEDGRTWLLASAKNVHQLVLFDADTGERLRAIGRRGQGEGEFLRPNGVFVLGDLLFVSERDNRRVQMLQLPDLQPLGSFGEGELRSPYGLWAHEPDPGVIELYVTDSFMDGARFDVVPPLDQLDRRLRRYRIDADGPGRPQARSQGVFGATDPDTALRMVESLAGDPAHDRLLVADEDRRHATALRGYRLDGRRGGGDIGPGVFEAEPEGLALWACTADSGYWIAADQLHPLTIFRVFDRATLAPRGSFTGTVTAGTDGIALHASATARFPAGALFAVHDDRAVAAFDLRDIARALQLDPACLE